MNIRPRNDKIVISLEQPWREYTGPLVLPDNIKGNEESIRFAKVLAVGPGDFGVRGRNKERVRIPIEVGQRVLVDEIALKGYFWKLTDDQYALSWRDVLGIVEE